SRCDNRILQGNNLLNEKWRLQLQSGLADPALRKSWQPVDLSCPELHALFAMTWSTEFYGLARSCNGSVEGANIEALTHKRAAHPPTRTDRDIGGREATEKRISFENIPALRPPRYIRTRHNKCRISVLRRRKDRDGAPAASKMREIDRSGSNRQAS